MTVIDFIRASFFARRNMQPSGEEYRCSKKLKSKTKLATKGKVK